jgi:Flp pilus assembly protein TadB
LPVHHGLGSVADETPAPLCGILEQIVYHFERGRPLSEVLKESRRRLQVEAFTMLCLALEVSLERGGQVNQPLEQLTVSLQDWSRIRRRLESETASGRFSVLLMSLAPAGFCVLFWMAGIDAITLFVTDFLGQCVLSAVALLIWAGNRWAARIMCLELS